jgi:hypothetical protein
VQKKAGCNKMPDDQSTVGHSGALLQIAQFLDNGLKARLDSAIQQGTLLIEKSKCSLNYQADELSKALPQFTLDRHIADLVPALRAPSSRKYLMKASHGVLTGSQLNKIQTWAHPGLLV